MSMALPTPEQVAWADCGVGVIIHLDIQVFEPEYDFRRSWGYTPDPRKFNPEKLDTDQWLEAARSLGARYAVLVAKHCSGFSLWPTGVHDYSVRSSRWRGGRGDIVRDFIASCRRCGVLPGLYCSTGCNAFCDVDDVLVRSGDAALQERYNQIVYLQLDELWGRYGELFEIWFDGGALPVEKGGPDLVPIYQKHQPDAIVFQGPAASIRWIGNEQGVAAYPCWATVPHRQDYHGPGDPDGRYWLPGECDVPVRNHEWFWTPNAEHKLHSVEQLMDMYYRSVGRNCNLLLNANPNPEGLVPQADFQRYVEFGKEIRRRFDTPLARTEGSGSTVELRLPKPSTIDHVVIMEDIRQGERIRRYRIEGLTGPDTWQSLCEGQSVGHKRIEQFASIEVAMLRLRTLDSVGEPLIRELAAYHVG